MKKSLFAKIGSLFLGLSMGLGVVAGVASKGASEAKAEETTLTFNLASNPGGWPTANSTTLTNYTYTLDGKNYTFGLKNVKSNSGYLMLTKVAALGLPSIEDYKLTKVVAANSSSCSTSVKVGVSSSDSNETYISGGSAQTWSSKGSSYTYNLSNTVSNTVYYLYVTSANAQITELSLTYESTGTPQPEKELVSIAVTKQPNKTEYIIGDSFDPTGIEITATYSDASTSVVTEECTFSPTTFDTTGDNITVTVTHTASNEKCTLNVKVSEPVLTEGTYYKVTKTEDIESGQYLIVYETGNLAFDGSLTTLDAVGNTFEVVINNNSIAATTDTENKCFTYDVNTGSLMSKSGYYIGKTASGNGMNSTKTFNSTYSNSIDISSGNAVITAFGGSTLRYNYASDQKRFRYYGSGQQAVQLYKKYVVLTDYFLNLEANNGTDENTQLQQTDSTFTLPDCTFTTPEGKQFAGWSTSESGNIISGDTYTIESGTEATLYAIWENAKVDLPYSLSSDTAYSDENVTISCDIVGATFVVSSETSSLATITNNVVTPVHYGDITVTGSATGYNDVSFTIHSRPYRKGYGLDASTPLSAEEALAVQNSGNAEFYVSGVVTQVDDISSSFNNATFWLGDFEIYRVTFGSYSYASDLVEVNDTVIVQGKITLFGETIELATGGTLISIEKPVLQIASIEFDSSSALAVTQYYVGDEWDLTGLKLKVNYTNGTNKIISLPNDDVECLVDPEEPSVGDTSFDIMATYEGFDTDVETFGGFTVEQDRPMNTTINFGTTAKYWSIKTADDSSFTDSLGNACSFETNATYFSSGATTSTIGSSSGEKNITFTIEFGQKYGVKSVGVVFANSSTKQTSNLVVTNDDNEQLLVGSVYGSTLETVVTDDSYSQKNATELIFNFTLTGNGLVISSISYELCEPAQEFGTLASAVIKTNPSKTEFEVGEEFTSEGLVLTATDTVDFTKDFDYSFTTDFDGYTFTSDDIGENKTVTVTLTVDGISVTVTYKIAVKAIEMAMFELVTKKTELVSGSKYLIVGIEDGEYFAMAPYESGNNFKRASIPAPVDNTISLTKNDTSYAKVTLGGSTGNWTLFDGSYYLKATGDTRYNYMVGAANADSLTAQWSIAVASNGVATIKCVDTATTRNWIRHNTGSDLFSCYSSGQADIYLYKLIEPPTTGRYYIMSADGHYGLSGQPYVGNNSPVAIDLTTNNELKAFDVSVSNNEYHISVHPAGSGVCSLIYNHKANYGAEEYVRVTDGNVGIATKNWTLEATNGGFIMKQDAGEFPSRYLGLYNNEKWYGYTDRTQATVVKFVEEGSLAKGIANSILDNVTCDNGVTPPSVEAWDAVAAEYANLTIAYERGLLTNSSTVTEIQEALAKYDYIVGKYGSETYQDFLDRNPVSLARHGLTLGLDELKDSTWIVAIVAIAGLTAIGGCFFYRKRKEN